MSTPDGVKDPAYSANIDEFFDDSTVAKEAEVKPTIELPVAYIHNPNKGNEVGGLCVKKSFCPPDTFIGKNVQEVVIAYDDDNAEGGSREEEVYILQECHIAMLAFDHDTMGRPKSRTIPPSKKELEKAAAAGKPRPKNKYALYITGYIRQLYHPDLILSIKFGGPTHAFRFEKHLFNFMKYIVGETTRLKGEEQVRRNLTPTPASWNQFFVPLVFSNEKVTNEEGKSSWVAALQEYEKLGLRIEGQKRNGVSTLKKFSEATENLTPLQNLMRLFIPKHDKTLALRMKEQMQLYAQTVKELEPFQSNNDNNVSEHFTDEPKKGASDEQIAQITELCSILNTKPEDEVQYLRSDNKLKGGDESANQFSLSSTGAEIVLDYLKLQVKQKEGANSPSGNGKESVNTQPGPTPGVQRRQPEAPPLAKPKPDPTWDEDDIPF